MRELLILGRVLVTFAWALILFACVLHAVAFPGEPLKGSTRIGLEIVCWFTIVWSVATILHLAFGKD